MFYIWLPMVDSNYRPLLYRSSALPTELIGNGRRTIAQCWLYLRPMNAWLFCQSHLPDVEVDILPRFETCATFFEIATHVF